MIQSVTALYAYGASPCRLLHLDCPMLSVLEKLTF